MSASKYITSRGIVVTGWVLLVALSAAIVGSNLYMWLTHQEVPKALENWGAMVIGFLLGSFVSIVKEFLTGVDT